MSETISPEERLFKVIQQGKLAAGRESGAGGEKNRGWIERFKRFIASWTAGKTGADGKEIVPARIKWPELEPESINKVLAAILAIVLGFIIYTVSGKQKDVAVIMNAVSRIKASPEEGKKITTLKELSFYLNEIRKRDIFHANAAPSAGESGQKKSETFTKAVENMKLQGISWGGVPKAMILWKDGKESKMYFLVEGQAIGTTGYKVIEISRTSVKVSDGNEETVLL